MNGGRRRAPATAVAVTLATAFLAACADDGGGDSTPAPTLPPIATTTATTLAPTTTVVTPYEVRRGDTLGAIATAHSVTVDAVLAANPEIASADDIHEGQVIQIPAPSPVTSTTVDQ